MRGPIRFAWLLALVLGCTPTSREIEDVLAAHKAHDRYVDAPASLAPREWDVGQWVLYRIATGGRVGYVKHAVVDWAKCGVWLETTVVLGAYEDRTTFKVCFHKVPDATASVDEQRDLLEAYMMRRAERTTAIDLGDDRKRKQWLPAVVTVLEPFPILAARSATREGRHEIVVRAGQFAGVHDIPARMMLDGKPLAVLISFHPEVPLGGVLEAVATNEDDDKVIETELMDYGLTGAKSELPDFDRYAKDVGLD